MENASKALLIAGAILIAILLIAIAMYIFGGIGGVKEEALSQMTNQEKDMYNADIKSYIGDSIRGSNVKAMIERVISKNQANAGTPGKFISITVNVTTDDNSTRIPTNYTNAGDLNDACEAANYYNNGDNTNANVQAATQQMNLLKSKINSSKNYKVTETINEGVYTHINIEEIGSPT